MQSLMLALRSGTVTEVEALARLREGDRLPGPLAFVAALTSDGRLAGQSGPGS